MRQLSVVTIVVLLSFAGRSAWGGVQYTVTDLGTLGGSYSCASGINDSGQVVGEAQTSSGYGHAFLYSNGTMVDLGTLGGLESWAQGINASGQVVGASGDINNDSTQAFLYSNGTMVDLGTLPGCGFASANAINDNGQIVGNPIQRSATPFFTVTG